MTDTIILDSNYYHPNKESFMDKFTDVVSEVSDETLYIGANSDTERETLNVDHVKREPPDSVLGKIYSLLDYQAYCIRKLRETDPDVVLIRTPVLVLVVLYCRIFRIDSGVFVAQKQGDLIQEYLTIISMYTAENLLIESFGVLEQWGGRKFEYKSHECVTYIDTDKFYCESTKRSEDQFIVGYLGLLTERKGVHILLDSIRDLQEEKDVDISFEIAGIGDLMNDVENVASEFSGVNYHGFLPDEEVPKLYRRVDLMVLPTSSEGVPNVVLESMACCTPVLATPVGGIPDIIKNYQDGFILEHREGKNLSKRLSNILLNTDLEQISRNSREKVVQNYSRSAAIDRYNSLLKKIEQ